MKRLIAFLIFACLYNSASALVVFDPNYTAEIYATYSGSNVGIPHDMTFGDSNNLYITQRSNGGVIWCVDEHGVTIQFVSGLNKPRGIDWGGGTGYGDYLYVALTGVDKLVKISTTGIVSHFSRVVDSPAPVEIDRVGNYGNFLYTATFGWDKTYKVTTGGSVIKFSNFPGDYGNAGPFAIGFDPSSDYEGSMYIGTTAWGGSSGPDGLFKMNTSGGTTRFVSELRDVFAIEFDDIGYFNGNMFVTGSIVGVGRGICRVMPDGTASLFIQQTYDAMRAFTFGSDGAMYVAEYSSNSNTVVINRVIQTIIPVALDIKPESCPNPLNLKSKGTLSAAILGSQELDVNTIDVNSIRLVGVSAIRSSLEDIAAPVADANDCNCTIEGPDGYIDLALKFKNQKVVEQIFKDYNGDLAKEQTLGLELRGKLLDGSNIGGSDCVKLVGNVPKWLEAKRCDGNEDGVVNLLDLAELAASWLESCGPE